MATSPSGNSNIFKEINETERLKKLNQYGILLIHEDGHYYFEYETDLELSPTTESKELLNKSAEAGIIIRSKQYGDLTAVLDRFDNILKMLEIE